VRYTATIKIAREGVGVVLFDPSGKRRAYAVVETNGKAYFGINDQTGKPVWNAR